MSWFLSSRHTFYLLPEDGGWEGPKPPDQRNGSVSCTRQGGPGDPPWAQDCFFLGLLPAVTLGSLWWQRQKGPSAVLSKSRELL